MQTSLNELKKDNLLLQFFLAVTNADTAQSERDGVEIGDLIQFSELQLLGSGLHASKHAHADDPDEERFSGDRLRHIVDVVVRYTDSTVERL